MPKIIENLEEKLVSEARRQVLENGYAALTIRSVAAGCGVGVGTVYNYFPSKEALAAGFLLEDWMDCLNRIRAAAAGADAEGILHAVYDELTLYLEKYDALFKDAQATMPAPPKRYHHILRGQISKILEPCFAKTFYAEFAADALLTWTVEGKSFDELYEVIAKIL